MELESQFTVLPGTSSTVTALPSGTESLASANTSVSVPSWRWARPSIMGLRLAWAVSTLTAIGEPVPIAVFDSSVVLVSQRSARRRVSLKEARENALLVLRLAEQRRLEFAEMEGKYLESLYGMNSIHDLRVP